MLGGLKMLPDDEMRKWLLVRRELGIDSVGLDTETRILSQDTVVDKLADELKSRLPPE